MDSMNITKFYANQDIFITGGLGFLGKVLIEKLIRSCSDLNNIFILIRGKRDKTPMQRLNNILNLKLFDTIKNENPLILKKLIPIIGNVSKDNMDISLEDLHKMRNVSIIFHSAATVKFNEPLKESIITNVKGTLEVLKFAETLKGLKAFIHVSTTYCNLDQKVLEEKIYPPYASWQIVLNQALKSEDFFLNGLLEHFKVYKHNSYTLSKHFAEQLCNEFKDKLPIAIFRPAIVIPSVIDPIPGWIDNLYGPMGISVGVGTGLIKTIHADSKLELEWTAVDISAKIMILAAYKRGTETEKLIECPVYNCSTGIQIKKIVECGTKYLIKYPLDNIYWVPDPSIVNHTKFYLLRFFLLQLLPAIVIDGILMLGRKKPFFVRLQKNIYYGNEALYNFASTKWTFKNDKAMALEKEISPLEMHKFAFVDDTKPDLDRYMKNAILGSKQFLFNESINCNSNTKLKLKFMIIVNNLIKIVFYCWLFYNIYKICYPFF